MAMESFEREPEKFGQICFRIGTNIFLNLDKYILKFGQIQKDKVEARRQPFIRSVQGGRQPDKEHFSVIRRASNTWYNLDKYML